MDTIDIIYEILKWIPPQNLYIYKSLSKRYYNIINILIRKKNKYYIHYVKNYITLNLFHTLSTINYTYNINITTDIISVYNYIKENYHNINHHDLQFIINKLYNKLIMKILDVSIHKNIKIFELTNSS